MKIALIVVLVLVVLVIGWVVMTNNQLVVFSESINGAWAQVETVLQRRYDLIPNLVNTVKGYAKHESGVLEEVTRLRSQWGEAKTADSKIATANQLESALSRLMVVVEKYPDLKANQNFMALSDELAGTENRIAVERRRYNETVQQYNIAIAQFPANVIAGMHGFQHRDVYFKSDEAAKPAPQVHF
ncbi:MAG: LemA family protein [Verrucomicrobiota bacterium]